VKCDARLGSWSRRAANIIYLDVQFDYVSTGATLSAFLPRPRCSSATFFSSSFLLPFWLHLQARKQPSTSIIVRKGSDPIGKCSAHHHHYTSTPISRRYLAISTKSSRVDESESDCGTAKGISSNSLFLLHRKGTSKFGSFVKQQQQQWYLRKRSSSPRRIWKRSIRKVPPTRRRLGTPRQVRS